MATKLCDKCGETVDEAKAFCPACGNAFVEEERRSISTNFEEMDMTVQLGQTMYNQMLSDMGLNVSKAPDVKEKVIEVAAAPLPAPTPDPSPALPSPKSAPANSNSKLIWTIVAAIAVIFFLAIIVIVAAAGIIFYLSPRLN